MVLIKGAGDKAFCAGGDIRCKIGNWLLLPLTTYTQTILYFRTTDINDIACILAVTDAGKVGDPLPENFFKEEYILNSTIGSLAVPWIACIHGITMGGVSAKVIQLQFISLFN